MKTANLIVGVLALSVLTGCTSESAATGNAVADVTAAPVKEVTIDAFNFGFTQSDVQINKGDTVRIRFRSVEGRHGLGIPGLNVDSGVVEEGQAKVIEFVADKSGSFDYRCNVPCGSGHRSMKGILVVNE